MKMVVGRKKKKKVPHAERIFQLPPQTSPGSEKPIRLSRLQGNLDVQREFDYTH